MYNGVINVLKEAGFTSFDVVAKLRGILKQRKIGHTGTLDPEATGVLLVCLGNATKLCDLITDRDKEYIVDFELGYTTDTLDHTGVVLTRSDVILDRNAILDAISKYAKDYMQLPPMYSALKVGGKKLVDLARKGIEIERQPRKVAIHEIEVLELDLRHVKMRVKCGKGTYIRSLCDDIGKELGCGATMTKLIRSKVSGFSVEDALTLSEIERLVQEGTFQSFVLPADRFFMHCRPVIAKREIEKFVYNGNKLNLENFDEFRESKLYDSKLRNSSLCEPNLCDSNDFEKIHDKEHFLDQISSDPSNEDKALAGKNLYRLYDEDGRFCGIYEKIDSEKVLKPFKLFMN